MNVSIAQTTPAPAKPERRSFPERAHPHAAATHPAPPLRPGARRFSRIDLILIGARGQVGSALRRQLGRQQSLLRDAAGLELSLIAAFDRRGFAFDLQGLAATALESAFVPRQVDDVERLLAHVTRPGAARTIVIDCTASDEIADCYPRLLAAGVGVVGANKRANSRSLAAYRNLQQTAREHGAPYRYETTVGAAIPLLGPLRDLRLRGERVSSIQGVLSGSLSYILHRLHTGCAFSAAVAEARALGYTEPDPLEDLRATDLARKLLVLARESGFALESDDLRIEPLIEFNPADGLGLDDALAAQDESWRERIASAIARDERWIVLAEADENGGRIGLRAVPAQSAFGQLKPGQNLILIRTDLQDQTPLTVSGPGAGPEITAAGVLSDVLAAAAQLAGR
jgi:aspartokinase/homoserine dehydrogenase 1